MHTLLWDTAVQAAGNAAEEALLLRCGSFVDLGISLRHHHIHLRHLCVVTPALTAL